MLDRWDDRCDFTLSVLKTFLVKSKTKPTQIWHVSPSFFRCYVRRQKSWNKVHRTVATSMVCSWRARAGTTHTTNWPSLAPRSSTLTCPCCGSSPKPIGRFLTRESMTVHATRHSLELVGASDKCYVLPFCSLTKFLPLSVLSFNFCEMRTIRNRNHVVNQVFNENPGYEIGKWQAGGRVVGRAGVCILNGVKLWFPLNNFSLLWPIHTKLAV